MKRSKIILSATLASAASLALLLSSCSKNNSAQKNSGQSEIAQTHGLAQSYAQIQAHRQTQTQSQNQSQESSLQNTEDAQNKTVPVVYDFSTPWTPALYDDLDDPSSAYSLQIQMDKAPEHLTEEYLVRSWEIEILSSGNDHFYFDFGRAGNYRIFSPFGGYQGAHGKYELQEDKIIIHYGEDLGRWSLVEELFPEQKDIVLEYDYSYKDYSNVGVLKSDAIICRSGVEFQKPGTICYKNNIELEKIESIYIVPSDNMKLRKTPDLKGTELKFFYTDMFWRARLYDSGIDSVIPNTKFEDGDYSYKQDCLLKGMIVRTAYKTTKQDTVDGITAPWYLIFLAPEEEESWYSPYWVFGGFMEKLGSTVTEELEQNYTRVLLEEGLSRGHLIIDEEKLAEENAKKMCPVIDALVDQLYKQARQFETNDLLQNSPVKIGMTLQEIEAKYGKEPYPSKSNIKTYYGEEYYLELTFTTDILTKIKVGINK